LGSRSARNYFRTHLDFLGYHEHKQAFDITNIPASTVNKAYHLSTRNITGIDLTQQDHKMDVEIIVSVFKKAFTNNNNKKDECLDDIDAILKRVLNISNIINGGMINVSHQGTTIDPFDDTNDKIIKIELTFLNRISLQIN